LLLDTTNQPREVSAAALVLSVASDFCSQTQLLKFFESWAM
jgi:hypothetical protein